MKRLFILLLSVPFFVGCSKDGDTTLPDTKKVLVYDNFDNLDPNVWTSLAQVGTKKWALSSYSGNGYAQFNPYGSGQPSNVAWLIYNPSITDNGVTTYTGIDMDKQTGEVLTFQTAQAYLKNIGNTLEVFASTDFDGINFQTATWEKLPANIVTQGTKYAFVNSGNVDLSKYKGKLFIAFKAVGDGSNNSATFQIDNFRISCDQ